MGALLVEKIVFYARKKPDFPAIIYQDHKISYAELWRAISSLAGNLRDRFSKGSRLAICMENSPEMVFALYAIPLAGLVVVPIEANTHERNLDYILANSQSEGIVLTSRLYNEFAHLIKGTGIKTVIVASSKHSLPSNAFLFLDELLDYKRAIINSAGSDNDAAIILYTTGTTGPKKGVILSHFNLFSAVRNINLFMGLTEGLAESLVMPLSHSFAFARLRCVFDVGGTVILENGLLRPEIVLRNIKKYNAESFASVPLGFAILLNDYYRNGLKEVGGSFRYIEIGSAPMPRQHKTTLMDFYPRAKICMHFGLTEASRSTFIEFHSESDYLDTVGRPTPNVVIKIGDEVGNSLPMGCTGDIYVKSDTVMQGYWNNPELTSKSLRDGWLRSGDLGRMEKSGYLYLLGRKEDVINLGGIKIGPEEVEEVLLSYKGVLQAAVVAGNSIDATDNQTIRAYLVVKDKQNFADAYGLKRFCLAALESYKVPHEFIIVDSLPRNSSGKIQRHLLRDENYAISQEPNL